ncbi:MAG: VWA domain-containing protein, partial [Candidatus Obscuribacterales bacterium]|nr:VWA domain-containing protein [Candidatus Obscuribacterales bacterium]
AKCDGVAEALNSLLYNLTLACMAGEDIRDYVHIGVLGYGGDIEPRFSGDYAARELLSISEAAGAVLRTETRQRSLSDGAVQNYKVPVWFEPVASGKTPMRKAFRQAHRILGDFLRQRSDCFPPVVVNITDGESTDGDPSDDARALSELSSTNGNVLLLNVHISSRNSDTVAFPLTCQGLLDPFSRRLFSLSSSLPDIMVARVRESGEYHPEYGARGFIFNGKMSDVSQMLDIGTRTGFDLFPRDGAEVG